jgi:LacI family transcriptional regulator
MVYPSEHQPRTARAVMSSIPSQASASPVGIKDIARALGISTGTVDRALHAKPGINPMTRARVLRTAEALGYRPNLAARYLKSRKTLKISVHLPRELALFWDSLREGIREAAAMFEPTLHVDFRSYPRLGKGDVALFEQALEEGTNGLIIAPGDPAALKSAIRKASQRGIPVACVVTDAPDTPRLTSVSADPFTVGAVAGELLTRFVPQGGPAAFFTGWLSMQDHADKLRGFQASLDAANGIGNGAVNGTAGADGSGAGSTGSTGRAIKAGHALTLAAVVEAHDDEREAYKRAINLLKAHPDLQAIYVSTVNSLPVLRAIEARGRARDLTVVTTDLFPELVTWIRAGTVVATVYQRPISQGRLALQALYQFLADGTCPQPRIKVVPHVVMRSNLDLFLERTSASATRASGRPATRPSVVSASLALGASTPASPSRSGSRSR